jgi:hypothetical protein
MSGAVRPALAAAVMLAYHLVTASVARGMGLAHEQAKWFELGIWFIYVAAGFVAGLRSSLRAGMAAALAAGLADGVLGWRITAAIYQPMRIWFDHDAAEFTFAVEMLVISAIMGAMGAGAGTLFRRLGRRGRTAAAA